MPITVQWEDARGKLVEQPGDAFLILADLDRAPSDSACLRYIDPYGDTVFNRIQLPQLAGELRTIAESTLDKDHVHRILQIATLADQASGELHTYLRFLGD